MTLPFLELSYGIPHSVWTAWGEYRFGGDASASSHAAEQLLEAVLAQLGATVHRPFKRDNLVGEYGPVYGIHRVDDLELPEPVEAQPDEYFPQEDAKKIWREFTRRYQAA